MNRIAVVLIVLVVPLAASAARRTSDPPVFIPWRKVGDIALGMYKARVQYEYGADGAGFHVLQHLGSYYSNGEQGYYDLHGTHVIVSFYGNRVGEIGWSTPYYRTARGFGVGSSIPLGPCHRTATNPCEYRWSGFVFHSSYKGPCNCWIRTKPAMHQWLYISTSRGRITNFYLATRYPG